MINQKIIQRFVVILLILACIIVLIVAVTYLKFAQNKVILKGISLDDAKNKANGENYYLVTECIGNTGVEFEIIYGNNRGSDIDFTGNSPKRSLSNVFFLSKINTFLIKGTGRTWNKESIGKKFEDNFDDMFTVEVEEWYIVIPIKRDYQYRTLEQQGRWFAPKYFIDQFDVDNGDYIPEKDIGRVIE